MNAPLISRHLLWKDYHQVRPALLACCGMMACLMLLSFALQLTSHNTTLTHVHNSYMLVVLMPMLSALSCSGMLVGQERQSRTWQWSSSLPISWSQALISKSLIWLAGSLGTMAILAALYGLLYGLCLLAGYRPPQELYEGSALEIIGPMMMMSLEGFVVFTLFVLLWKDPLTSMIVASAVLAVAHLSTISSGWTPLYYACSALATLGLAIVTLGAFKWRWTVGQTYQLRWALFNRQPGSSFSVGWHTLAHSWSQPSEWKSLLTYALQSHRIFRLVVVGFYAIFWMVQYENAIHIETHIVPLIGCVVLLSSSAFGNDNLQDRIKFFADRGVDWRKFLISAALPPLVLTLCLTTATILLAQRHEYARAGAFWMLMGSVSGTFLLGLLASMAVASPLLSPVTALVTTIFATWLLLLTAMFWDNYGSEPNPIPYSLILMLIGLVAVVPGNVKFWLVRGRPLGWRRYLLQILAVATVPLIIVVAFAFLLVPNRPWQGLPREQVLAKSNKVLNVPEVHVEGMRELEVRLRAANVAAIIESAQEDYEALESEIADSHAILEKWDSSLSKLELAIDPAQSTLTSNRYKGFMRAIELTSLMAFYSTKQRHADQAVRSWKINRHLIESLGRESIQQIQFEIYIFQSWLMRSMLTAEDWQFLFKHAELEELVPKPLSDSEMIAVVKDYYSNLLYNSENKVSQWIPMMRWYTERRLALQLEESLNMLSSLPQLPHSREELTALLPISAMPQMHSVQPKGLRVLQALVRKTMAEAQLQPTVTSETKASSEPDQQKNAPSSK